MNNNKPSYKEVQKNWKKAQKMKQEQMKREGRRDPYDQPRRSESYYKQQTPNILNDPGIIGFIVRSVILSVILYIIKELIF